MLFGAGSDVDQVCERNYFCRKIKGKISFEIFFRRRGGKKGKAVFKDILIPHAGGFCCSFVQMERFCSDVQDLGAVFVSGLYFHS